MKLSGRRAALAPDPEVIRELAKVLAETGLTEIEYAVGEHRIRVAREPAPSAAPPANGYAAPPLPAPLPPAPEPPKTAPAEAPGTVASPMVGVAYLAPQPGAAPFVAVGDRVSEGQTVLIIEAMKVMNQIRAPRAGQVVRILVEDGAPVEYGAPLLVIE